MKWKFGVVLSLALLVGFGALGVRSAAAAPWDVFDLDSKLYVPYYRADANTITLLVVENPFGPGAVPNIRFYDQDCKFIRDLHPPLTTADVDFFSVNKVLEPATGEGGILINANAGAATPGLSAETIVIDLVAGTLTRFHHINQQDGAGIWNVFADTWTGAYFDANGVDNELYLFCPKKKSATETQNRLGDDLIALADSPVNDPTKFSAGVDLFVFDADENLIITVPVPCTCVTRALLEAYTTQVNGRDGRIVVTSIYTGGDDEDFIAFMKTQIKGTNFVFSGYMFSSYGDRTR